MPCRAVVVDERLGLAAVDRQPVADRRLVVVVTLEQLATADVTDARALAGGSKTTLYPLPHERQARRPASRWTSSSSGTSMSRTSVSAPAGVGEHLIERAGLLERAREAVEHESLRRVRLCQALADDADHDLVGDQLARIHERFAAAPSSVPAFDGGTQDVAGRDVRQPESGRDALGLRTLARAGRAEQHDVQWLAAMLLQEALVVAHEQLGFHLTHRVERDADDDEDRGAAEVELTRSDMGLEQHPRQHGDGRQEERAGERQPREDPVEELGRRAAGAHAGHEPAVLLEVVGLVDRD